MKKGDVMIVPAGVSHGMLENRGGFEMLGGYPIGAEDWDFCVGKEEEKGEAWERIKGLAWFEKDPVYGDQGPVLDVVGAQRFSFHQQPRGQLIDYFCYRGRVT